MRSPNAPGRANIAVKSAQGFAETEELFMSSTHPESLDIREQIIRIDRAIAETHKLQAETNKFSAEAAKLRWDRWIAPVAAVATVIIATATALGVYLKH
jgi:hypothetical protein